MLQLKRWLYKHYSKFKIGLELGSQTQYLAIIGKAPIILTLSYSQDRAAVSVLIATRN